MKQKMTFFWCVALFAATLLTNCGGTAESAENNQVTQTVQEEVAADKSAGTTASTSELLQGKWQSVDDESNYLVFEGEQRKEIAGGMDEWEEETFVLSRQCANPSDSDNGLQPEEDRYISCVESDLCWYIIEIDEENLSLSYMGRGNTLTYKRVK